MAFEDARQTSTTVGKKARTAGFTDPSDVPSSRSEKVLRTLRVALSVDILWAAGDN